MSEVLSEHLSYISDARRLAAFRQAVERAVAPGDTVVDIGSGFGVLGLMCLKAGAAHVWGIDSTPAIEIARETASRAGLAGQYTCIPERSFRTELPHMVDVLICDHVGYFGFDYRIIATVGDARRRFLRSGGKLLPQRIVLHAAAVQSPACRALSETWSRAGIPAEFEWLREYAVNTRHPYKFAPDELGSAPAELGIIDLAQDSPDHLAFTASLPVTVSGELDGLAGWFACELTDGVWMTNSPLVDDAINRSQAFLPFAAPLKVEQGDVIEVTIAVRHEVPVIAWTAQVVRTGQRTRQSTWNGMVLHAQEWLPASHQPPSLRPVDQARRTLLGLVDGRASHAEIERAVLQAYPALFPTTAEIVQFVRLELSRIAR